MSDSLCNIVVRGVTVALISLAIGSCLAGEWVLFGSLSLLAGFFWYLGDLWTHETLTYVEPEPEEDTQTVYKIK